jgi:hypothetical protein
MKKAAKRSEKSKKAAAERVMGLLAAGIIFIGLAIVILAFWLGGSTTWMKIVGKVLLADVFIAVFLLLALSSFKDKSGVVGTIFKVAFWNMQLWLVVIQLIFPSMLILLGLITIVLLPYSLVNFLLKGLLIVVEISQQTIMFLSLSMGAIVTAHYSKPLFKFTSSVLTSHRHQYERYFPMMVEYVYKPANMQFVVYFLYVIYLVVSTVYRFENSEQRMIGNDLDLAVLESFLVFIAFSNMKAKYEAAEFKFSQMFKIMFAMWTTHDDDLKEEKNGEEQA